MRVAMPNSPIERSASVSIEDARRGEQRVLLTAGVLGEVVLQLAASELLVGPNCSRSVGER